MFLVDNFGLIFACSIQIHGGLVGGNSHNVVRGMKCHL